MDGKTVSPKKGKVSMLVRQRHARIEALEKKVFLRETKVQDKREALEAVEGTSVLIEQKLLQFVELGGADSGTYKAEQNRLRMLHRLETMEHSNECVSSRLNQVVGKNAVLRQEINDLRQEKFVYLKAFERLRKELTNAEETFDTQNVIIERKYELRDKAQVLCRSVLDEFNKRQTKLQQELADLNAKEKAQAVEEEEKEREAMSIKDMMGQGKKKKGESLKGSLMGMKLSVNDKSKSAGKKLITDIAYLNEMWKRIHVKTGVSTADELAAVFSQMEKIKLEKMMEATSHIADIKSINSKIRALSAEQKKIIAASKTRVNKQKDFVSSLQKRTDYVERVIGDTERKLQVTMSLLRNMIRPLNRLQQECDPAKLTGHLSAVVTTSMLHKDRSVMLDDTSTATDILSTLSTIEQRVTEVIQFYLAFMQSRTPKSSSWKRNTRRGPSTASGAFAQQLTSYHQEIASKLHHNYSHKENHNNRTYGNVHLKSHSEILKSIKSDVKTLSDHHHKEDGSQRASPTNNYGSAL